MSITMDKDLKKIAERFSGKFPGVIDEAVRDTTGYAKGLLIRSTAKGRTGQALGGWLSKKVSNAVYLLWNRMIYAKFLETGTGLFGPKRKRIFPKTKKYLVFPIVSGNTAGEWIRVKSTKGMKAQPMIKPNEKKIQKDLNLRIKKRITKLWKDVFMTGMIAL